MSILKLDSSPLIYAVKGNYLDVFRLLYSKLVIVDSVYEEVVVAGKKRNRPDAFIVEKLLNDGHLEHHSNEPDPPSFPLGLGELSSIHAAQLEKCAVLVDDIPARRTAIQIGVETKWTLLLFLEMLKQQLVNEERFDTLLESYVKIASPSIVEYQIIVEMKKLVM